MDRLAAVVLFFSAMVDAFVSPSTRVQHSTSTSLNALPEFNPFLLSDGLSAATYMHQQGSEDLTSSLAGGLSALRTFFIVVSAAIFGITAVAYLTAAFLVPKAAEQLERDTKRLSPGLWDEYESKLEVGETMVNRPDLLQELGNLMQPIIKDDYEKEAEIKFGGNKAMDEPSEKDKGAVIDALIQPED